jgi:formimidoylglutamate deiminase
VNQLFARHALLPEGWARDVHIAWDGAGTLTHVCADATVVAGMPVAEYVLPGMVNLHSHAFQRALGGLAEQAGPGPDSFWTWRDLMYRFAATITPEQLEAIAAQLFVECLRHGYTALCEFHYIQRDTGGGAYARPAEMAERVAAAAGQAGIGLSLLPVLYSHAGFGAQPLASRQQRFRTGVDDVLEIVAALAPLRCGQLEVGAAPHSLRAAGIDQVRALVRGLPAGRCTSTSPNSRVKSTSAWPFAASARLTTFWPTSTSTRAGACCTPPT